MDQGRRTLNPNGSPGNPSSSQGSSLPSVTPSGPWHSTPVKKSEIQNMARQLSPPVLSPRTTSLHIPQDSQTLGEMESATIQRQRRELLLLVAELKDRDQELNTTAAAHHKQLQAWEQDRQRVLTLEQRSARLEDELHKRNEVIRAVTKHVHIVEAREKEVHRDLNSTQQQLHDLGKKEQDSSRLYQDLEERNRSLSSTVTALSAQVGSLQVREAELSAMLRLKDKDVTEATNHIVDLSGRLRESEASLQESRSRERRLLREEEARKRRHREVRNENARLKGELQEQMTESSAQREEMIRLKQESQLLRSELALSGEGKSWKDDLLGLARSKQERTESELHCLRQVCENQQNDLQLLQLNLESARESLKQNEGRGSAVSESVASQGTERGGGGGGGEEGGADRQAMSRSTDRQALPFPSLTAGSQQEARDDSVSGSTSDLTDVTMATSDLATSPARLESHSTGETSVLNSLSRVRPSQSTGVCTGSEPSYSPPGNQSWERKDSMATCSLATCSLAAATGSLSQSADQSTMGCSSSVSGNNMASFRPKRLFCDQELNDTCQETPGLTRTETVAPSSVARTTMSIRPGQVRISGRTATCSHQGTLVINPEGDGTESEGGVATKATSLSGRTESPGRGCNSTAEATTCGRGSSLADGEARRLYGCGSITEGQTGSCSFKAASGGGGCVAETATYVWSHVAKRHSGPCCGCASEAGGQGEANPSSRHPSEAETGSGIGAGMELLAVFNGGPQDSSISLLEMCPAWTLVWTCLADLGSIYLDDPSPSPWTRRNPGPANDSASPTATNQQAAVNGDHGILSAALGDDDQRCSSGLLQRLLAESREMVASLERAKLQPLSPSHNCDAVLSRSISQDSGSSGSSHQRHHHAGQGSPCGPSHQRHHHVSQGSPCGPSHQRHHHVSQGSPCGSSHHHQGSPCGSSHHHQGAPCGSSHHRHDSQGSPYHPAFQTHQNSETPPRGNQCLNNTKEPSGL